MEVTEASREVVAEADTHTMKKLRNKVKIQFVV
jgi:hypothetical protein